MLLRDFRPQAPHLVLVTLRNIARLTDAWIGKPLKFICWQTLISSNIHQSVTIIIVKYHLVVVLHPPITIVQCIINLGWHPTFNFVILSCHC